MATLPEEGCEHGRAIRSACPICSDGAMRAAWDTLVEDGMIASPLLPEARPYAEAVVRRCVDAVRAALREERLRKLIG